MAGQRKEEINVKKCSRKRADKKGNSYTGDENCSTIIKQLRPLMPFMRMIGKRMEEINVKKFSGKSAKKAWCQKESPCTAGG